MGRSRKRRRWPWVILFATIALVGVFYVGGAWYFSGQVYADALKAELTPLERVRQPDFLRIIERQGAWLDRWNREVR